MNLVGRIVPILCENSLSGFRYCGVNDICSSHFPNTVDIVEKGIFFGNLTSTVALAV